MNRTLGWVALAAGIVELLQVFGQNMVLLSLAWEGAELRRPAT